MSSSSSQHKRLPGDLPRGIAFVSGKGGSGKTLIAAEAAAVLRGMLVKLFGGSGLGADYGAQKKQD